MEDNFPMEQRWGDGFGMIQVHYSQAYLLPHNPVPNRPARVPVHGPEVGAPALQASSGYCVGNRLAGTRKERQLR